MNDLIKIGRLAFRREGLMWNTYYAQEHEKAGNG